MADAEQPFVHLHCHTDFSLLDGCAKVGNLLKRAQSLNMPALAITDHGNLFGLADFYKTAKKVGVKPLLGCEIYLVIDHAMTDRPQRRRGNEHDEEDNSGTLSNKIFHMGLLARNFEGYQNLARIVTAAHTKGFYYKPRVDFETLAAHANGLIGFTGCLQGVIPQHLLRGDWDGARKWTQKFIDVFGRDYFIAELMNHGLEMQITVDRDILKLAREFKLKTVATNDIHYNLQSDHDPHDALLCIQTGAKRIDEKRFRFSVQQFYMKSRQEMAQIYGEIPEVLDNTVEVASMCDVALPFGENHYPVFHMPPEVRTTNQVKMDEIMERYVQLKNKLLQAQGKEPNFTFVPEMRENIRTNGSYLLDICIEGLKERYGVDYNNPDAYIPAENQQADIAKVLCERIDYELSIIAGTGFVDYFLIVHDFIAWARAKGISVGPGRGSGAGCLVAYLLHITDIDPLRFGLLFERFLNPERVSPPDFDIDFCMRRRDEVVDYVRRKYGQECVANIITFGKFGAKMVVRDMARVLDVPFSEADRLAKMVPDDLNITLDAAFEKSQELQTEVKLNPIAREILDKGKVIEGMVRNTGKHACGIIIGDRPLVEFVPLTLQEGDLTTQYAKEPVEELGLLKMDFLGLKTLTVIADAEDNVRRTVDPKFDISKVGYDDPNTFELLNSGRTVGVFQLESGGMQSLCRQFQISSIDEIIALIALYRPGPMDLIPDYIRGKRDPSTVKYPHPLLENVCRETYGIMVYQEQVMEAARIIAGYSLGGADILRRAMGKKKVEVMEAERAKFVKGAAETHGIEKSKAEEIFKLLEKFAGYGFNKSHSAAYAILSYRTAYLKANYPVQFMAAILSCELGNAEKCAGFIDEAIAMGIKVSGPDINRSREAFTPVIANGEGSILFGMAAIKGVGEAAASSIIKEREQNGPFKDFADFAARIDSKSVNRRVIEALIKTGAFDALGEDRGALLDEVDAVLKEVADLQRDREAGQTNLFDMFAEAAPANTASSNGRARSKVRMPMQERLQHEKDLLGFYVSGHPMNRFRGLAEQLTSFKGDEWREEEDREPFRLCGVITAVAHKISKKDNRPWAILSVGARTHSYQVNLYPEAYQRRMENYWADMENYKRQIAEDPSLKDELKEPADPLSPGAIVVIEGSISQRNDDPALTAESVRDLERSLERLITNVRWIIEPNGASADFLRRLHSVLMARFGETQVEVGFLVDDNAIALANVAGSLTWRIEPSDFTDLYAHPAVKDVEITSVPIEKREPAWMRFQTAGARGNN